MAKVCILCAEQFQDMEVMYPLLRLMEAGHGVTVAGMGEKEYKGKYGYPVATDTVIAAIDPDDFDAFIVPGGWAPDFLRRTPDAARLIARADEKGKLIGAICHAGWVLASAKILKERRLTSFFAIRDDLEHAGATWTDEAVVVDGNLITARNPFDLPEFMKAILHWLKEKSSCTTCKSKN